MLIKRLQKDDLISIRIYNDESKLLYERKNESDKISSISIPIKELQSILK